MSSELELLETVIASMQALPWRVHRLGSGRAVWNTSTESATIALFEGATRPSLWLQDQRGDVQVKIEPPYGSPEIEAAISVVLEYLRSAYPLPSNDAQALINRTIKDLQSYTRPIEFN